MTNMSIKYKYLLVSRSELSGVEIDQNESSRMVFDNAEIFPVNIFTKSFRCVTIIT